jgi:hypothetical protein
VWYQEKPGELPGVPMTDVAVRVRVEPGPPKTAKMRRMAPEVFQKVRNQLSDEKKLGLWEASNSAWSANLTTAPKDDKTIRICADYKEFNKVTKRDKYPIPRMEDIRLNIAGKRFISLVDLTKGFNNLFIHPDDRDYLAVITPIGLLRPPRMPFGWANGPGICQREVDLTLGTLNQVFRGYIDDISGGTEDNQRLHDLLLCTVLYNFNKRGFRFHAGKAQLLADHIRLVGCNVDAKGVTPSPKPGIFEALRARKHTNIKMVQRTIGALQWFAMFVPNFTYTIRHLTHLLKQENRNGARVNFTEQCAFAIDEVERYVLDIPQLVHSNIELKKEVLVVQGDEAEFDASHKPNFFSSDN